MGFLFSHQLIFNVIECEQSEAEHSCYDALFKRSKVQFDQFVAQGKVLHNYANILELLLKYSTALQCLQKGCCPLLLSFENDNVLLMSLKAGGVCLNLTATSNAFLMDPWWNPAVEEQAIMRIHRIGQKRTVCVRRFIVK
ncbi:putative SWI/SNF-related matrix-associated actin-dependent regulator of chromatin subfamily A member 3-like protein 3, partial [Tanacetum coccineum]